MLTGAHASDFRVQEVSLEPAVQQGMNRLKQPQRERLVGQSPFLSWWSGVFGAALLIFVEMPAVAKGFQRFGIKPGPPGLTTHADAGHGIPGLGVREAELQFQTKVVEAGGWR